ncbi:hypothetical protein ABIE50_005516 [Chitinophaga sp. OAE865]
MPILLCSRIRYKTAITLYPGTQLLFILLLQMQSFSFDYLPENYNYTVLSFSGTYNS